MRQMIGRGIRLACRRILYVVLGLRIPAARIRAEDLRRMHQQAADRVRESLIEANYWTGELIRPEGHVERAEHDLQAAIDRGQRLRLPNPLFPVEKM